MEQHPIPQQISSYEFKLVGDMTLKQFLKAAVGIILAVLIRNTGLIALIRWPLMLLFAGGGLALAFVPFKDRPLETWIISFFKSIYSPTIYTYKKKADKSWLDTDLAKITTSKPLVVEKKKVEEGEVSEKVKGKIKLRDFFQIRSLRKDTVAKEETKNNIEEKVTKRKETVLMDKSKEEVENINEVKKVGEKVNDWRGKKASLGLTSEKLKATGKAVFGSIPMPDIPEVANVVVGMATSGDGKIVDGVIVEIQDEKGNPSRVLKTNSLGQFKISTPLASGRYLIIAEKDGHTFDRVNLDLTGKIVEPIKIIAHN
jgi:hypothetical protein